MKNVTYILLIILTFVSLSSSTTQTSQMPDTRSVVKALYIYTFATLVEWPAEKTSGDFVIGVYGENVSVYEELNKKYSGKSIGSQKIIIKNYLSQAAIDNCHILYVTEENSGALSGLAPKMAEQNTLLVGDHSGSLSKGAVVNFVVVGNQQKYEINKKNAKKNNLVIAEKLSTLAANVIK